MGKRKPDRENKAQKNRDLGIQKVDYHPIFSHLCSKADFSGKDCPKDSWAVVESNGTLHLNSDKLAKPDEWSYVIAHCLLHLGMGHFQKKEYPYEWNIACDLAIAKFLHGLKMGIVPGGFHYTNEGLSSNEEKIYEYLVESGVRKEHTLYGTSLEKPDMFFSSKERNFIFTQNFTWEGAFEDGLSNAVVKAIDVAGGKINSLYDYTPTSSNSEIARKWFIDKFPLLASIASSFKIIENLQVCQSMQIQIAAVNPELKEIYIQPGNKLNLDESKFVIAHELLHASLRHDVRRQGRDPYYWNVACDYVVNQWLLEMGIGVPPEVGVLIDPIAKHHSAESLYDEIVQNLRRYRKLRTLRGIGISDIIERKSPGWWNTIEGISLDEFYRRALFEGYEFMERSERGFLPSGLIEEIRALQQKPIPWDVALAYWFDENLPSLELKRTYARPSRRQSSTPDIPRPRWYFPEELHKTRTFGVVLDTSMSMSRTLLGKAIGTIVGYSISREVKYVRLVFCDATYYDEGFIEVESLLDRVRVKGRGGTVLQPGIHFLENAKDFPEDGPILVITDGYCDSLTIRRNHAFLLPEGNRLPFKPGGKVFYIK